MVEQISNWVNISFFLIYLITVFLFYYLNDKPKKVISFIFIWSILHSILALNSFYFLDETSTFNNFVFILVPAFVLIFYGALSSKGKQFYENRNVFISPILHIIRVPVEIVLYYLAVKNLLPAEMTFEGRNFDIIAGITAPIICVVSIYFSLNKRILLIWNLCCLGLIFFILVNGILSSEITYKQFGFSQANKAIMYFPYILLPAVIVPIVIYTHITDIILLSKKES